MANVNRQITLTQKGNNSGPFYDVYYSLDCITYTICIDGLNVFLPNVGSTAIVTLPDNTQCIKLVNKSPLCNNEVIQDLRATTTTTSTTTTSTTSTTTTTAAPTTTTTTAGTTTTTTLAPTTTTTTFNCITCNNWEYNNVPVEGDTIYYYRCSDGAQQTIVVSEGQTGNFCNCDSVGNPTSTGTQLTQIGVCTTTTTSTTTTTTTAAPTTTTTTAACCQIDIPTNNSLDVEINTVEINGTAATVIGGVLPNEPGNGTTLCSTITGTVDVTVTTFNSVSGQNIVLCDSNVSCSCYDITGTGPATWTWNDVYFDCNTPMTITVSDGACQ
jgi:hypothetical protein